MRVVTAMSGGVDSSVAAALLKRKGYEVIGIHLLLTEGDSVCCGTAGYELAQRAAVKLKLPFYALDLKKEFERLVIEPFCYEYGSGRTPNPCIRCNQWIKFEILKQHAAKFGARLVATGHYAQIVQDEQGRFHLLKGVDQQKDQSYFLYPLNQEQLSGVLLPIGEYTKTQVRELARELELPNANRKESQEICFIPNNDYPGFLKKRHPELFQPGPVYDMEGRYLREHQGIVNFTVGQRKGLGMAFGERRYVVRIDPQNHAIYLGPKEEVYQRRVWAENVHWVANEAPANRFRVWAKVRYQDAGGEAEVEILPNNRVYVKFDQPQWAPTPGQAIVFWDGDEVLGGGMIVESKT